jgi:hypothetical protein
LAKEEIPLTTKFELLLKEILITSTKSPQCLARRAKQPFNIQKANGSEFLSCTGNSLDGHNVKNLKDKYSSLTVDKSTNISNIMELTISLHFAYNRSNIREMFLCLVKLEKKRHRNNNSKELKQTGTDVKYLVACSFDGAVNFLGNISGVQRKISETARR